ncbi:MAG: right-handed parallel beta-helix repeat-containing protein, partial [Planctomycetota bacterium]
MSATVRMSMLALLLVGGLTGCDGDGDCASHSDTYCQDDVAYWMDSCGKFEEVLENCQCGCEPDHTGCRVCDCSCSQADACCDGCHFINEGMPCDDGDPGTTTDICRSGICVGWTFDVAEPAAPAVPDSPAAPAEPAEPAGIQLESWTCPAGWLPVEHESLLDTDSQPLAWCQPPPLPRLYADAYTTPLKDGEQDGDRPVCDPATDGSYPLLGYADCRPLGDACPAGDWPDIPPEVTGNRIYVRAGSAGVGTQASPYGTISQAVATAASGDVVVIGPGSYPESVSVDRDLTLWGKCVAESIILAPGPHAGGDAGAVIVAGDHRVDLVNLRISGEQIGVRVSAAGAAVTLQGVWIHQATRYGVLADAGNITLSGVLISSTSSPADGQSGIGLGVWSGAQAQIEAATVENNRVIGITALDSGTVMSLTDTVVRNTESRQADQLFGRGLEIGSGAQATGARVLVDHNRNIGAMIRNASTVFTLTDAAVVDTQPRDSDRTIGVGLQVQTGARVDLTRGLLERNHNAGIVMSDTGTTAGFVDLIVRDTRSQEVDGVNGEGLWMMDGAYADCSRALFSGNHSSGILAQGQNTRLVLQDGAVLDTESQATDQRFGRGLEVNGRAHVTVTRGLFENNRDAGIVAIFSNTLLELEDVTVRDTRSREATSTDGMGLGAAGGADVTVLRGRFERNRDVGVYADGTGTTIDLTDVTVSETQSAEADRSLGRGLNIQEGAQVTVLRGRFEQNREHGVFVASAGTVATLEDITVSGTQSRESDRTYGRGLETTAGAQATCRRALFEGNRDTGIMAGLAGTRLVLEDTTVSGTLGLESNGANGLGL